MQRGLEALVSEQAQVGSDVRSEVEEAHSSAPLGKPHSLVQLFEDEMA